MTVITRFAPSPTGMLHIGSARTALFNYLFARHHGGQFKLRVEDTDLARNSDAAYQAILDAMNWLGLPHDGEIVYQSQRAARHKEVAEELVKRGSAYYCYTTQEELAEQRAAAEAKGDAFKYDRRWRPDASGNIQGTPPSGVTTSVRIKSPMHRDIIVHDAVQGDVRFGPDALDDLVILRSDGTPTYNLAVVVDDHDMGVTHVIRGDDHLNNAGRQSVIYQAMGWEVPVFAHIPLIHGPDGAKLSKRHGATSTTEYATMGYLPEAMRNYLARLGWSHGDDEIFTDQQAIDWFTLDHVGQSPSRLDFAKLNHVNAHYLRLRPDAELAQIILPLLEHTAAATLPPPQGEGWGGGRIRSDGASDAPLPASPLWGEELLALLIRAIPTVKTKAQTIPELAEAARFYLTAPVAYDEKATAALAKSGANLPAILTKLEALSDTDWQSATIKQALTDLATETGKKLGELMPPIRAALVGAMSGPDVPDAMEVLGKAEAMARLRAATTV